MTTEAKDVVTGSSSPGWGKTPPIVKGTGIESSGTGPGSCNALNLERRTDPRQHTSTSTAALTGFHGNRTVTDGACLLPPPEEHTLEQARCTLRPPCRLESSYPEHGGSEGWTPRRGEAREGAADDPTHLVCLRIRRTETATRQVGEFGNHGHCLGNSTRPGGIILTYAETRVNVDYCQVVAKCPQGLEGLTPAVGPSGGLAQLALGTSP